MMFHTLLLTLPGGWELLMIGSIIGIIVWAFFDAAMSKFDKPQDKFLWISVIVFLGIFGAVGYLLFGRKGKMQG
ncbi:MAG: PLDc_N domain-containing protein [Bacteroidetes bacterium]|nr:MAG: PLDc_N domain-containing protein [Bacteroidota bacterium]